jgi:hypothetical protein
MPASEHRADAAEPVAARGSTRSAVGDGAAPISTRAEALLDLQGVVGNRAVADLVALDASGEDAGAAIDSFMMASGAAHPALQRASAALRRKASGLFGSIQRTPAPRPAGIPEFSTVSVDQLLRAGTVKPAKHGKFPVVMGQTAYERDKVQLWPSFNLKYERPGWHIFSMGAKPQPTGAAVDDWWAIGTPANEDGYKMPEGLAEYPGYDYYIKVSAAAAALIAQAEVQHINDLDQGWAITGAATAAAINAAANEDVDVTPDRTAAKTAAVNRVAGKLAIGEKIKGDLRSGGRLEDALAPMMMNASNASAAFRDQGKHTIPVVFVDKDEKQKRVNFKVDESFSLDTTPSATVVNPGTI